MYLLLSWTVCRFNFVVVIIIIVFSMIISIAILSLSVFLMIILRGSDQIIVVFRFWGTRYIPVKDRRKVKDFLPWFDVKFLCSSNNCFFPTRTLAFHPFLAYSQLFDWNSVSWHALIPKSSFYIISSSDDYHIWYYHAVSKKYPQRMPEHCLFVCLFVYRLWWYLTFLLGWNNTEWIVPIKGRL